MKQTKLVFFILLFLCLSVMNADGKQHSKGRQPVPTKVSRPAELRGSKEQRIAQNTKAINLGIGQIETEQELLALAGNNNLVELKTTDYYLVDRGAILIRKLGKGKKKIICPAKDNRVFVYLHVAAYIDKPAFDFFQEFHKKLKMTSGARSLEEQVRMRTKGSCYYTSYAAQVTDPLEESLHVRALAIDISRQVVVVSKGRSKELAMSRRELLWMRHRLIADKLKGVEFEIKNQEEVGVLEADPIEESICFHVVVFPR